MEERVKRPKLERTEARRGVSSLLGLGGGGAAGSGPDPRGGASFGAAIGRSVELGYRVVEDYIRQGQRTAERMATRSYGQEAMAGDVQELGMRAARYASEFMAVWFDFVERTAGNGMAPPGAPTTTPPSAAAGTTPAPAPDAAAGVGPVEEGARVRVEVASPWPTAVELDLRPGTGRRLLVVHALRALEPEKPRLDGVEFHPAAGDEPPVLRLRVPPDQPAGTYHGLLVDPETAVPAGTLSVRIARE